MYYPLPEFKAYLQIHTDFEKINTLKTPGEQCKYGKFVIYRLTNESN